MKTKRKQLNPTKPKTPVLIPYGAYVTVYDDISGAPLFASRIIDIKLERTTNRIKVSYKLARYNCWLPSYVVQLSKLQPVN